MFWLTQFTLTRNSKWTQIEYAIKNTYLYLSQSLLRNTKQETRQLPNVSSTWWNKYHITSSEEKIVQNANSNIKLYTRQICQKPHILVCVKSLKNFFIPSTVIMRLCENIEKVIYNFGLRILTSGNHKISFSIMNAWSMC